MSLLKLSFKDLKESITNLIMRYEKELYILEEERKKLDIHYITQEDKQLQMQHYYCAKYYLDNLIKNLYNTLGE